MGSTPRLFSEALGKDRAGVGVETTAVRWCDCYHHRITRFPQHHGSDPLGLITLYPWASALNYWPSCLRITDACPKITSMKLKLRGQGESTVGKVLLRCM